MITPSIPIGYTLEDIKEYIYSCKNEKATEFWLLNNGTTIKTVCAPKLFRPMPMPDGSTRSKNVEYSVTWTYDDIWDEKWEKSESWNFHGIILDIFCYGIKPSWRISSGKTEKIIHTGGHTFEYIFRDISRTQRLKILCDNVLEEEWRYDKQDRIVYHFQANDGIFETVFDADIKVKTISRRNTGKVVETFYENGTVVRKEITNPDGTRNIQYPCK